MSLTIELRRVMDRKENVKNYLARNHLWVKFDCDNFCVTSAAVADTLVVGVLIMPTGIAAGDFSDALKLGVGGV